jgi:predicted component of type VI protein secretion system
MVTRLALALCAITAGCQSSEAKDREIAELKAKLATNTPPAPNPQPDTVAPPIAAGMAVQP